MICILENEKNDVSSSTVFPYRHTEARASSKDDNCFTSNEDTLQLYNIHLSPLQMTKGNFLKMSFPENSSWSFKILFFGIDSLEGEVLYWFDDIIPQKSSQKVQRLGAMTIQNVKKDCLLQCMKILSAKFQSSLHFFENTNLHVEP